MRFIARTLLAAGTAMALLPPASWAGRGDSSDVPEFPSDAEVVLLDLVARGKKDRPVLDLEASDVRVYENEERCEILSFRLVQAANEHTASAARGPSAPLGTTAPTPVPARAGLVVLVFDALTPRTAPLARDGALALLSRSFPPDTWFAVTRIAQYGGTQQVQAFTSDRALLEAAVVAATVGEGGGRTASGPLPAKMQSAVDDRSTNAARVAAPPVPLPDLHGLLSPTWQESQLLASVRGLDTLYALLGISRGLEPIRGRKAIVYFAESAWQIPDAIESVYETLVSTANRANVAVHTVDARGLVPTSIGPTSAFDGIHRGLSASSGASGAPTQSYVGASLNARDARGTPMSWDFERAEHSLSGARLETLADDTGGLAIANTNDLGSGLQQAIEELGSYYEVVYAPPDPTRDGTFRRIRVETERRGVKVRARAGYFATPESSPTMLAYELPLIAALDANEPAQDFPLATQVLHFGASNGQRDCVILAEVPMTNVLLRQDPLSGATGAHLTLLAHLKDDKGRLVARLTHDWRIDDARPTNAFFRSRLSLEPGRYVLQTAVQDRHSHARSVGALEIEIPEAKPGLAMGSATLLRRVQAAPGDGPAGDPLRVGDVTLFPSLRPHVVAGFVEDLPLYVPIYPALPDDPVRLTLELHRDGEMVTRTTPELPRTGEDGRIAWIGSIPLAGMEPGSYEIVIRARQGGRMAEERTSFDLRPPSDAL